MYVEFNIPHVYFLSNISIVPRPMTLKLCYALVCRDLPILFIIYTSLGICARPVEFSLNNIYLLKSNEEYFNGSRWVTVIISLIHTKDASDAVQAAITLITPVALALCPT